MRRLILLLTAACSAAGAPAGSTRDAPEDVLERYVEDPAFRRAALESSLVTQDNAYAQLRLAKYDEEHWGALPEWNPETTPLGAAERGLEDAAWSAIDASSDDLRAIGERAFFNYPVQLVATLPTAVASEDRAGMWLHEGRTGAVWARVAGGRAMTAFTCATCHASMVDGALVAGRNNAELDVARMAGDGERGPAWSRGTVDVTADGVENPAAIPDLRAVRYQQNLHHAATLRNDPAALAVRIETLIITSLNESVRPPRKIVAGLTAYLWSLGETKARGATTRGRELYARECAGCHHGDEAAGAPLRLDQAGTDPLIGESRERGTGMYRIPSLRFVGDRHRLFASGAVEDVADLLTPSPGRAAKGHTYGLGLPDDDRAALLEHLRGL